MAGIIMAEDLVVFTWAVVVRTEVIEATLSRALEAQTEEDIFDKEGIMAAKVVVAVLSVLNVMGQIILLEIAHSRKTSRGIANIPSC